ncbi:MAG: hypothetical protein ACREVL_05280 [Solimonas sp.]
MSTRPLLPLFVLVSALISAVTLPRLAAASDIDKVPGVSDEPALAPGSQAMMSLGYTDRSSDRAAGKGGDGAVTFSEETRDGRVLPLRIDPISGAILSP